MFLNLFIGVILDGFDEASNSNDEVITEEDFARFARHWEKFDPHATCMITVKARTADWSSGVGPDSDLSLAPYLFLRQTWLVLTCDDQTCSNPSCGGYKGLCGAAASWVHVSVAHIRVHSCR